MERNMIYTVTFNPSLDYIVTVEDFACGAVNRTTNERIFPGGKGLNVSMVLKNLGVDSTALGFLAGFTGRHIEQLLAEKGVSAEFIWAREGMSRINVKLRSVQATDGCTSGNAVMNVKEETEINGQGPKITEGEVVKLYAILDKLQPGDILVLAGSIPSTMPSTIYMDIMKCLEGREIQIVVDATGELLKKVLSYQPFLIKPNNHELGELFGVSLFDKESVIEYAKKLQEMGAKNVLVSMAGDGAVLVSEHGEVHQAEAPRGIVKNSVGAGDSMVAGFLAGYLDGKDLKKAFQMGVCTGSASAFSEDFATLEEVQKLLHQLKM